MTDAPVVVLYEDPDVLVVDKPAGVTVIPAREEPPERSLHKRLEAARGERLWVVHRLDRDTSGALAFARTAAAHRALSIAFETRAVRKAYVAFACGARLPAAGRIDVALHAARKGKMRPALAGEAGALASVTAFEVVAPARETPRGVVSRVELAPETGRQHQIRVHLRYAGAALLVDPLYANVHAIEAGALGHDSPPVARLTLHARALALPLRGGARAVTVTSELPADLAALDRWLVAQS